MRQAKESVCASDAGKRSELPISPPQKPSALGDGRDNAKSFTTRQARGWRRVVRIAAIAQLDRFQIQPIWEMSDKAGGNGIVNEKSRLIGVVGSTVCLLGLVTSALAPALSGGGPLDYGDFFPLILVSALGAAGFLGWIVVRAARAERNWLIPLGLVATCSLLFGLLAILSNQSAISFESSMVQSAEERAERYRGPQVNDSKGEALSASHVRRELDNAVADANRYRENLQHHKTGRTLGVVFVIAGIVAGAIFRQVRQRGRAGK